MRIINKIIWWLRYRFHPQHRYHVLKIGNPGYSDPRHQLIYAIMGIFERYIQELRSGFPNIKSDKELIKEYIKLNEESNNQWDIPNDPHTGWIKHYNEVLEIMEWWELVKNHSDLDCDIPREYLTWDVPEECMFDYVDKMLNKVTSIRSGMWT